MAKVTFITQAGETITLEATSGSIMELAVNNGVQGIEGACGGVCSCATCHVHVDPEFFEIVGQAGEIEADILELDDNVSAYSRLGCQIQITDAIDNIKLTVANE